MSYKNITIMTKFDNKFIPNTPKTFQVLELRDQQQEQQPIKKSSLSPAARAKVINKSGSNYLSEKEGYGPCYYSGCPWPASVPCCMEINIEGINRKWARMDGNGDWLSGYWEPGNFNSSQLSRRSLIVNDVDQSRRVLPLLSNDSVYTLNFWGRHCAEDSEFCNVSMDIIRKGISHHESGHKVDEKIMLDSDISKWSRYAFKAGVAVGASLVNPAVAIGVGAAALGAGAVAREVCDSPQGKRFWGTVSDVGGSSLAGGVVSSLGSASGFCESWTAHEGNKATKFLMGSVNSVSQDASWHGIHRTAGKSYDSNCSICNP